MTQNSDRPRRQNAYQRNIHSHLQVAPALAHLFVDVHALLDHGAVDGLAVALFVDHCDQRLECEGGKQRARRRRHG